MNTATPPAVLISLALSIGAVNTFGTESYSCSSETPFYEINLSHNSDTVWNSAASIQRDGECCYDGKSTDCVVFAVQLNPQAWRVNFEVIIGDKVIKNGEYKLDCAEAISLGQPICVEGDRYVEIAYCKPGVDNARYRITSIPLPTIPQYTKLAPGQSLALVTTGMISETVTWQDLSSPVKGLGYHMECFGECDSVRLSIPPVEKNVLTYEVCGIVPKNGCTRQFVLCDTVQIEVLPEIPVTTGTMTLDEPTINDDRNETEADRTFTMVTPNGDGVNDHFELGGVDKSQIEDQFVFSPRGEIVFQGTKDADPWDGRHNGQLVPPGAYFYLIQLQNSEQPISGTLSVAY